MRRLTITIITVFILLITGCVIQFIPEIEEEHKLLVVEGLITDQYRTNKIKLSWSLPLGKILYFQPVKGCRVSITDERGRTHELKETESGIYITDSTKFQGRVNGRYSLYIQAGYHHYQSDPVEMKPVPEIDSVYYEKIIIKDKDERGITVEECQIYLDSNDPSQKCFYYRWNFTETWEFHVPYSFENRVCWKTARSDKILIKNTSAYDRTGVIRFPVQYISNETDRLTVKYSILVNQYSLNEDEFIYWEKLKNVSENVGGLYDITPMSIRGNLYCVQDPDEPVLGYFSVSAVSQTRIFIEERFAGLPGFYSFCATETVYGPANIPIPGLNISKWIIEDHTDESQPYRVLTEFRQCVDCTVTGTNIRPDFWDD